jgi:ubiquinone/menaquinone biosynthesis C-methylase UbiE
MPSFDILKYYPVSVARNGLRPTISEHQRTISGKFGHEYFDGDREYGYGGYYYDPKYWTRSVRHIAEHYGLHSDASILDVGCAKGFMLKDFATLLPAAHLRGIDLSDYAITHCDPMVSDYVVRGCATNLPFPDNSFDLVVSINTIHNLERGGCIRALEEIQRVSKRDACVVVDAWRTEEEREAMLAWVLTAKTMLHANDWLELFDEAGYNGDYSFWTVS